MSEVKESGKPAPAEVDLAELTRFTLNSEIDKYDHLAFSVNKLVPADGGKYLDYHHVARLILRQCGDNTKLEADLASLKRFSVARTVGQNGSFKLIESSISRDATGSLVLFDDVIQLFAIARGEIKPHAVISPKYSSFDELMEAYAPQKTE